MIEPRHRHRHQRHRRWIGPENIGTFGACQLLHETLKPVIVVNGGAELTSREQARRGVVGDEAVRYAAGREHDVAQKDRQCDNGHECRARQASLPSRIARWRQWRASVLFAGMQTEV